MEKILFPISDMPINVGTLHFACYLSDLTGSRLTALTLENIPEKDVPEIKAVAGYPYVDTIVSTDIPNNTKIKTACRDNVAVFESTCRNREIRYDIHFYTGDPLTEILNETRFADLIILDPEMSFLDHRES